MTSALPPLLVWAAALVVALVIALVAYFGFGLNRRQRIEAGSGMATLNALKWRDFARLVSDLMRRRGLEPVPEDSDSGHGIDGFDLRFARGNQRYLVRVKQGPATHVSAGTLRELRAAIAAEDAGGGVVVTSGLVDREALAIRSSVAVEIVHGEALWKELLNVLPTDLRAQTTSRIRRMMLLRWMALVLVAALAGGAVLLVLRNDMPASPPRPPPPVSVPRADVEPAPAAPESTPEAPVEPTPAPIETTVPEQTPIVTPTPAPPPAAAIRGVPVLTEAEAEARRGAALAAVQVLDGVEDASWTTRSTLMVALSAPDPELRRLVSDRVCARLVEYEELRFTRLQIQESADRVRWAQCQ